MTQKIIVQADRTIPPYAAKDIAEQVGLFLRRSDPAAIVLPAGYTYTVLDTDSPTVYLCGTITPDPKHLEWRETAEASLERLGIDVISPIRGKDPSDWTRDGEESNTSTIYDKGGFYARDRRDVQRCDAILLAFPSWMAPERQSIGTWKELGWADAWDIPVVVWTDMDEIAKHPFVWKQAARICPTFNEAIEYLAFLFGKDAA